MTQKYQQNSFFWKRIWKVFALFITSHVPSKYNDKKTTCSFKMLIFQVGVEGSQLNIKKPLQRYGKFWNQIGDFLMNWTIENIKIMI